MVNFNSRRLRDWLILANGLVLAVVVNQLASLYFFRLDLTEEKRYTIKPQTRELLKSLDDVVYVDVYLEEDVNAGFDRLRKAIFETLEEFSVYSGGKVQYRYSNPSGALSQKARSEFITDLMRRGIAPLNVIDTRDGARSEKLVLPGAILNYGGQETGVMLLKENMSAGAQEKLNQAIEQLEFELANAIQRLSGQGRQTVGWAKGHGELDSLSAASLQAALSERYTLRKVRIEPGALDKIRTLIIAKPVRGFSEKEKWTIDQFLLAGGRILLLMDKLEASADSASRDDYFAFPYELNLDDQLFKYGVRMNGDLVQDRNALKVPVVTSQVGGKPQITPLDWPFYPLINHYGEHPATRNLDAVLMRFASTIDTVRATGIRKTVLLQTGNQSRKLAAPVKVSVNDLRNMPPDEKFGQPSLPLAVLLEGSFSSLYKNRFRPEGTEGLAFRESGVPAKLLVVADGDIARNEIGNSGKPQMLGLDSYTRYTFANQDLLLNMVAYLSDESGLITTRSREVMIRPLDQSKVRDSKLFWQIINVAAPLLLLLLFGLLKTWWRRVRYARF